MSEWATKISTVSIFTLISLGQLFLFIFTLSKVVALYLERSYYFLEWPSHTIIAITWILG